MPVVGLGLLAVLLVLAHGQFSFPDLRISIVNRSGHGISEVRVVLRRGSLSTFEKARLREGERVDLKVLDADGTLEMRWKSKGGIRTSSYRIDTIPGDWIRLEPDSSGALLSVPREPE